VTLILCPGYRARYTTKIIGTVSGLFYSKINIQDDNYKSPYKGVKIMKGRIYDKLCAIDDSGRASALASEPTVFCAQCGAEAHDPLSVCEPLDIQSRK